MPAFSPKALDLAAFTLGLSSSALGCLTVTGSAYWDGDDVGGSITTSEDGSQTCYGTISNGDNDIGMFVGCETRFLFLNES
jgi:hypothetical protein